MKDPVVYLTKLQAEPDHEKAVVWAVNFLHGSLIKKEAGFDTPEMLLARGRVFEEYGHRIIHLLTRDDNGEEAVAQILLVVLRTLNSPIDDADKLAHLREELLPDERVGLLEQFAKLTQRLH